MISKSLIGINDTIDYLSGTSESLPEQAYNNYNKNETLAFSDIEVRFIPRWANNKSVVVTNLAVFSISSYRPIHPVTSWGHSSPKGYTEGQSVFAGSLGFNNAAAQPLQRLIDLYLQRLNKSINVSYEFTHLQDIPPVDGLLTHYSETGYISSMFIKDMKFADDTFNASINSPVAPQTVSFICKGYSSFRVKR